MNSAWDIYNKSIANSEIPDTGFDFGQIFTVAVNVVTVIGFGVSFVMLAYSFVQLVMSTGDPKKAEKAQTSITWAVVGMLVISLLQGIKYLIKDFLGVQGDAYL